MRNLRLNSVGLFLIFFQALQYRSYKTIIFFLLYLAIFEVGQFLFLGLISYFETINYFYEAFHCIIFRVDTIFTKAQLYLKLYPLLID